MTTTVRTLVLLEVFWERSVSLSSISAKNDCRTVYYYSYVEKNASDVVRVDVMLSNKFGSSGQGSVDMP